MGTGWAIGLTLVVLMVAILAVCLNAEIKRLNARVAALEEKGLLMGGKK